MFAPLLPSKHEYFKHKNVEPPFCILMMVVAVHLKNKSVLLHLQKQMKQQLVKSSSGSEQPRSLGERVAANSLASPANLHLLRFIPPACSTC